MRRQAVVIGTGGHCRVILSLLTGYGSHDVTGIVDLEQPRESETILGISRIYPSDWLDELPGANFDVFLAIGNNSLRQAWYQRMNRLGLNLPNLISPEALIDPHARLGRANVVCARAFIGPEAILGDNNLVNTAAVLEHEVQVGSHCHFAPASTVAGRSKIEDNAFIGCGATVIDGIAIAANITIGAGATVVDTITEPGGLYVGVPARKVR